jgi:hypothetical protein
VVGSWDLHRSIGSNEWADSELAQGEATFDAAAVRLTAEAADRDQRVEVIVGNDWGGISAALTGGLCSRYCP